MAQDHIVKSFDEELEKLNNVIAQMGGLAEAQLAESIEALVRRDGDMAALVAAGDKQIDALERKVESLAVRLLVLRQPVAADLRSVLAALKISGLLERIGDYAKNVAKRTIALSQMPPMEPTHTVARMAGVVQEMIKNVLDAYIARDAEKADDVRRRDVEVDALNTSLFRELLTYMMEDSKKITACTHLLFVAKNIERMGDHATNIAESVHYLVRGENPEDERLKNDTSSLTVMDDNIPEQE